ncbi:serine/arginine repetitive matrix protein 1-like [Meles meles]|uniref:serine/arginine repetitive matrix protein 1-like n=1 Tax=Meles meles TaxID=9662 RepID=UPI001E69E059|nr:serine/arginine repetitive matrix protein 1-like [Meles meles]
MASRQRYHALSDTDRLAQTSARPREFQNQRPFSERQPGGDPRNSKSPSAQVASLALQVRSGTSRRWWLGPAHLDSRQSQRQGGPASSPSSLSAPGCLPARLRRAPQTATVRLGLDRRPQLSRPPRRQGEPRPPMPLDAPAGILAPKERPPGGRNPPPRRCPPRGRRLPPPRTRRHLPDSVGRRRLRTHRVEDTRRIGRFWAAPPAGEPPPWARGRPETGPEARSIVARLPGRWPRHPVAGKALLLGSSASLAGHVGLAQTSPRWVQLRELTCALEAVLVHHEPVSEPDPRARRYVFHQGSRTTAGFWPFSCCFLGNRGTVTLQDGAL